MRKNNRFTWLPRSSLRAYQNPTEPQKYPDLYVRLVEASLLDKAELEIERLKEELKEAKALYEANHG